MLFVSSNVDYYFRELFFFFFFFKQKTAYEMRISDWSSDVCSSDLGFRPQPDRRRAMVAPDHGQLRASGLVSPDAQRDWPAGAGAAVQIGRASCRERVCQYV